jgi:chemotaxis signal transduction protein
MSVEANSPSSASAAFIAPLTGDLRYGITVSGVQIVPTAGVLTEMVADARVYPVPKTAAAIVGVLNLRGTIVPLFDPLASGQYMSDMRPKQIQVLVFDREEQRVGVVIDSTPTLISLVLATQTPARPQSPLSPFLVRAWAEANQPQQIWWELDHRAAFEYLGLNPTPHTDHTFSLNPSAGNAAQADSTIDLFI